MSAILLLNYYARDGCHSDMSQTFATFLKLSNKMHTQFIEREKNIHHSPVLFGG